MKEQHYSIVSDVINHPSISQKICQPLSNVGFFHRRRVYIGDYTTSGQKSNPKKSPSARRARVIFWLLFATSGIICQYTRVSGERTALFNRKWRHKTHFNFTEKFSVNKPWRMVILHHVWWRMVILHHVWWRMVILHHTWWRMTISTFTLGILFNWWLL